MSYSLSSKRVQSYLLPLVAHLLGLGQRLQRNWHLRTLYAHIRDPDHAPLTKAWIAERDGTHIGSQVMMSLIIRLLVRLPMRQRCIREMRLGHNLKQLPDGQWEVHFRGMELKIASRRSTGINEYRHPVPIELNGLIDEWLTFWRPRRLPEEGTALVFLHAQGRPLQGDLLNKRFINAVYRFTGLRTTIHMVRDSWASDYLDATGDVSGCADMLGDTVPVILKHYAHVLKRRAQGRTAHWLQTQLGGPTNIDRPEGGTGTPR
jgi:integrase